MPTDRPPKRMHTVAKSYFEAFPVDDPTRRNTAGVWRFDRHSGKSKIIGVNDSEVVNDIYTVYDDNGAPDTGIETILCNIESGFADARRALLNKEIVKGEVPITREQWAGIAKFIAAQLLRTARFFQMMRDYLNAEGLPYDDDAPQRVMLILIDRWILRLVRMRGLLVYTETDLPFLTSDNPAVMWKRSGNGFLCGGVDQYDPELVVSCPLTPELLYVAYQTPDSLKAVHAEQHDVPREARKSEMFRSSIIFGSLPEREVKRVNQLCLLNAHKRVYANYCDKALLRLLENRFWGHKALYETA